MEEEKEDVDERSELKIRKDWEVMVEEKCS